MKLKKYALIGLIIFMMLVFSLAGFFALKEKKAGPGERPAVSENNEENNAAPAPLPEKVLLDVPFTAQAPLGNWEDVREQNGCEEATLLMAMAWVKGEEIFPEKAAQEIKNMSDYHLKAHGHFHDLSNTDTLGLLNEYFKYFKASLKENIDTFDIKRELAENKVVIIPIDGSIIGNPLYQTPSPTNHKIIVVGYDDTTQEFITHDPGTSQGKNFRYGYKILEESLADYPTGLHEKFPERKPSMIIVEK